MGEELVLSARRAGACSCSAEVAPGRQRGMISPCFSAELLLAGAVAEFLPFYTFLQHRRERDC